MSLFSREKAQSKRGIPQIKTILGKRLPQEENLGFPLDWSVEETEKVSDDMSVGFGKNATGRNQ